MRATAGTDLDHVVADRLRRQPWLTTTCSSLRIQADPNQQTIAGFNQTPGTGQLYTVPERRRTLTAWRNNSE